MEIQTELNDTIEHMQQKYGVEQFDNSTCFALSPYSAVNEKDPEGTKNWVTDNKDGTVTVKFPGDPNHPVTIQKPTKAEVAEFSGDETTATIEKAFSQYLIDSKNPEKFTSIIPDKSSLNFPQEYARKSKGGFPEAALKLFTNSEVKTQELAYATDSDVITALTDATNQNRAIIADSKEDQSYKSPITFNHSYKVGFDPITNEVILTNPNKPSDRCTGSEPSDRNGKALDGRDDGVFRISVEQFRESFLRFHSADVKKAQDS